MDRNHFLALSLLILPLVAAPAAAWGTRSHIDIANEVLADLQAGRTSLAGFGPLDLDPTDVSAILTYPEHFRGGSIAPDLLTSSFGTACTHNDEPLPQARLVLEATAPGTRERAFALGWICHVVADAVTHHYTNLHTGTKYDTGDFENVRLHAGVEIFLDDEYTRATDVRFDVPVELIERLYYSTSSEVFKRWAHAYREAELIAGYQSIGNIRAWLKTFWKDRADEARRKYDAQRSRPWYELGRYPKMAFYWLQHRLFLNLWKEQETDPVAQPNLARSFIASNAEFHRQVMDRRLERLHHAFDPFYDDLVELVEVSGSVPTFVLGLLRTAAGGLTAWIDPQIQQLVGLIRGASLIEDARKKEIRAHIAGDGGFASFRYHHNSRILTLLALQRNGTAYLDGIADLDDSDQLEATTAYARHRSLFMPFPGQPLPELTVETYGPLRDVVSTPHDGVAMPGTTTIVEAKFEIDALPYLNPDIAGREVEFFVGGKSIGKARTDADGVARLEYTPTATGPVQVSYRLTDSSYHNDEGTLTLHVLPPGPAVVFDIDGTLSDHPDWLVPFNGESAEAFDHSVEFVGRLAAEGFAIIYLTARDDALDAKTRAFLTRHGFPDAPILYNDWGLWTKEERDQLKSKNHGKFKTERIRQLMASGIAVVAGVGNAPTDAEAYLAVGIESYIIRSDDAIGPGSTVFNGYRDLAALLLNPTRLGELRNQARASLQTITYEALDLDPGEYHLLIDGTRVWPTHVPGAPARARATISRLAAPGSVLSCEGRAAGGDSGYVRDVDVVDAAGHKMHDGLASWTLLDTTVGQRHDIAIGP